MTIKDLYDSDIGWGRSPTVTISGFLVVTRLFSYLAERPLVRLGESSGRVVLVADADIEMRLAGMLPISVGTMVSLCGPAVVEGEAQKTGIDVFPIAITRYKRIHFTSEDGLTVEFGEAQL